jgi:hypothetical protein
MRAVTSPRTDLLVDEALDTLEACHRIHPAADRHEAAAACVEERLSAELGERLRGLAFCGSFGRGEYEDRSDLDVWAVTTEPWHQFCFLRVHGVNVDLHITSTAVLIAPKLRRSYRLLALDALVRVDRDGTFRQLCERIRAEEPASTDERLVTWWRLRARAVIDDAQHAVESGDPDGRLVLDGALLDALNLPWALRGYEGIRPARIIARATRRFPDLRALLTHYRAATTTDPQRLAIVEALTARFLHDVGGPLNRHRSERHTSRPRDQRASASTSTTA